MLEILRKFNLRRRRRGSFAGCCYRFEHRSAAPDIVARVKCCRRHMLFAGLLAF
jgi:hypothetical protein